MTESNYYCGPFYFPKCVRKYISKHFNIACKFHDLRYNEQKSKRKDIDKVFLDDMLASVATGKGSKLCAYSMYYLVRFVIGWPSWYLIKLIKWLGFKV